MNQVLKLYDKCAGLPLGRWVFSRLICLKAPYFGTIRPVFVQLQPGRCVIRMRNRRAVHNHIGSVHAIAMCCLAELTAGTLLEVTLPKAMRWIPKGMQVQYEKIARTDLVASSETPLDDLYKPQVLPIAVHVENTDNEEVFRAVIEMHITSRNK